jgi:phosphatidylglycerophosphate synthase
MNFKELKQQYNQSLKSMDTEEHIDLWFYRPLGFAWAVLFAKLGISPNIVTIASIFLGVGGGILLYFGAEPLIWLNYVGIFLIIWANTYDSADGQLARITKQYSQIGRILDGVSGDLWFFAIYFALVFRELHFGDAWLGDFFQQSQNHWIIWTIAIAAGVSHALQCAMADYYRQFHLYFLKGEGGSELESTSKLDEQIKQSKGFKRITMFFYRNYTANQERLTPAMQRLRRELKKQFGDEMAPQQFRDDFRKLSLPLMKYTNMLTFNVRAITIYVTCLLDCPWVYLLVEVIILNIMYAYMHRTHERLCDDLYNTYLKA